MRGLRPGPRESCRDDIRDVHASGEDSSDECPNGRRVPRLRRGRWRRGWAPRRRRWWWRASA